MQESRSLRPAIALGLAMFLPAFGTHGLNAGRGELARSLDLPADGSRMALLMAGFALAAVVAYGWVGAYGDRRGLRRSLRGGVLLFTAAHALLLPAAPLADALGMPRWSLFLGLRLLAGLAGGAITVSANALGGQLYGAEQRGRAMSLVWLGVPLALVVGVPLPLTLGPLFAQLPAELRPWLGEPYAAVALVAGLIACVSVLRAVPPPELPVEAAGGDAVAATLPPLRATWWVYATSFLMPFGVFPLIVSADPYAARTLHFTPGERAQLLLVLGVASVAGGLLSSLVADRLGRRRTLLTSLALFAGLTALLPWCGALGYVALAALLGLVSTVRQGPFQALASFLADQRGRGRFSARILIASQLGISGGQFAGIALVRTVGASSSDAPFALSHLVTASLLCTALALLFATRLAEPDRIGASA